MTVPRKNAWEIDSGNLSYEFDKETIGGVKAHVLNHFIVSLFSKHFNSFIEIFLEIHSPFIRLLCAIAQKEAFEGFQRDENMKEDKCTF